MSEETKNYRFITPQDCLTVVSDMERLGAVRAGDRALINVQMNGRPPVSAEEADAAQLSFNVNWLEGYTIAQNGILQVNSGLLYKDRFFQARCKAPKQYQHKLSDYSEIFTSKIHKPIKKGASGRRYMYLMKNRNVSLTMHGIGPLVWMNDYGWMPKYIALEDLLIPTDSELEFSQTLSHFAVNARVTPWQLKEMTMGEKVAQGWSVEFAQELIGACLKTQPNTYSPDLWQRPEEQEQLWKQRSVLLNSDCVPKIFLTYFFYQDAENGCWHRKIIVRENQALTGVDIKNRFLYDGQDVVFAREIGDIIHVQYGDGNVVAPLKYAAVRGLGQVLFAPVEAMNRIRNQLANAVLENCMTLLNITNPTNVGRPKLVTLGSYAALQTGVRIIPRDERYTPDYQFVEGVMSQFKQLMGESSANYVQDVDNASSQPRTATESTILLQSANKIVSAMLQGAYTQEVPLYEQIVRRFLMDSSEDPEVKEFQQECIAAGIPKELMKLEHWQIDIDKVLGGGDQTLANAEVQWLQNVMRPKVDPASQRIIDRKSVATVTRDWDFAAAIVPPEPNNSTGGAKAAQDLFGTLMQGVSVEPREGIEQTDYVKTMLNLMGEKVALIQSIDNMGTPQDVTGLGNVNQDILAHLQILASDDMNKGFVTQAGQELGKLMNEVKGFAQRQDEAEKAKSEKEMVDPAEQAKAQAEAQKAQQDMTLKQESSTQKMAQSAAAKELGLKQKQQAFDLQQQHAMERHNADMEMMRQQATNDLAIKQATAEVDLANKKKIADASAKATEKSPAKKD